MPRKAKKEAPSLLQRSTLGSSLEEILCMHPKRHQPLPNEILAIIATFSSPNALAVCSTASKNFLAVFGPPLWYRVTLKDLMKRTKDMDLPIIRQILSFIQVLVVHDKHSELCRWVRQTLPNLRTIIFAPTSGGLCSRMGKERAMEHTKVCGCIPVGRPIHVILHGQVTPIPRDLFNMHSYGSDPAHQPRITEISISFTVKEPYFYHYRVAKQAGLIGQHPLDRLNLIFAPVVTGSLKTVYFTSKKVIPAGVLHGAVYRYPEGLSTTAGFGDDIFSAIAHACISVSIECQVNIVNADQMPLINGFEYSDEEHLFTRSKTGQPLRLGSTQTVVDDRIETEYWTAACEPAEEILYEAKLQERVDIIKRVIKRWMELLLREKGHEDEIETRWRQVTFHSLAEYGEKWDMIKATK